MKAGLLMERGLPVNLDSERLVLGSVMLNQAIFFDMAGVLLDSDFGLEKHRKIYRAMVHLHETGAMIDRITVAAELARKNELESCDGLTYLVSLDDDLPLLPNVDSYIQIIKEKSRLRDLVAFGKMTMERALAAEDSPTVIAASASENLMRLGTDNNSDGLVSSTQIIDSYPGGFNAFLTPGNRERGLMTGFSKLDEMTNGLQQGEMYVIAGRPSMGKTALAMNIAAHCSLRRGSKIAVFSIEMSKESLLTRVLCAEARVDATRFKMGYTDSSERLRLQSSAAAMHERPLFIQDAGVQTLASIHSGARKMQQKEGLDLCIIDYLQLMSGGSGSNRNEVVSGISRGLKLMAKDLRVPVMVLSQLSRGPETRSGDHRPQLADLRESGAIEQDADLVGFVFREEVYKRDREDLRGLAELIIPKQRNGPIGTVKLVFLAGLTKFENRAEDIEKPGVDS